MKKKVAACVGVCVLAGAASPSLAFEFRCRFVERVGSSDIELTGNMIDASDRGPRRIRIQFGVFDDAEGPAPEGGFIGWNVGVIAVSGTAGNSVERRTNGRSPGFNFAQGPNSNGNPPPAGGVNSGDLPGALDWQMLTEIDATQGTQSPIWQCENGVAPPQPPARVLGRNGFVSVYEITCDPADALGGTGYTITYSGNLIAATEWRTVGTPNPPDCSDPDNPVPGSVTYAPFPLPPEAFSCVLQVNVPGPASAAGVVGMLGVFCRRRRRA